MPYSMKHKPSASAQVCIDYLAILGHFSAEQREDLSTMLHLDANRMSNMTGSRHSDAMRSAVRSHQSLGHAAYVAAWKKERNQ